MGIGHFVSLKLFFHHPWDLYIFSYLLEEVWMYKFSPSLTLRLSFNWHLPSCPAGPLLADGSCPKHLLGFGSQGGLTSWCHQVVLGTHSGEAGSLVQAEQMGAVLRCPLAPLVKLGFPRGRQLTLGWSWEAKSPNPPWFCCGHSSTVLAAGPATFVGPGTK